MMTGAVATIRVADQTTKGLANFDIPFEGGADQEARLSRPVRGILQLFNWEEIHAREFRHFGCQEASSSKPYISIGGRFDLGRHGRSPMAPIRGTVESSRNWIRQTHQDGRWVDRIFDHRDRLRPNEPKFRSRSPRNNDHRLL